MSSSERNKAAARAVFEVWNTGAVEQLDAHVAPDVVHHDPHDPYALEGLAGMKKTIEATRLAFPDIQLTVQDQIAEGDTVATRWTGTMTPGDGSAGQGSVSGITIDRFEAGKIAEAWRSMDRLGLLQSIGAIPRR
jgi:predicted ester cyclase